MTSSDTWRDEKEIIDLTIRYAYALDNRRFEDLALVFAEDGIADYGRLGVHTGLAAIQAVNAQALGRFDRTQHMVSNHQVTIDGDTASGRCYLQAQHVTRAAGRDHNYIVAGTYVDRYKRTDAGWRIAWRNLRVTWTEGSPGAGDTPTSETAFVIAGWIDVDPAGVETLLEAAVPMMTASLAEPGCQDYVFSADPATPGRIRIYEQWRSEADLRGHFETPHMEVFRQALEGAGVRDRNMSRYHVTHVGPVMEARSL